MEIQNFEKLARTEERRIILNLLTESLLHFSPENSTFNFLKNNENVVPSKKDKVFVLSIGKAAIGMFRGALRYYENQIESAVILTNEIPPSDLRLLGYTFLRGNHPFPGKDSINSTNVILNILENVTSPVLMLLSGGGSAMLEKPIVDPEEYNRITKCLMDNGADIYALNTVRCSMSSVKCGKLLNYYKGEEWVTLIISDVPGDDIRVISSGPSFPWKPNLSSIKNFEGKCNLSLPVEFESISYHGSLSNRIILKNFDFIDFYEKELRNLGYEVINLGSGINMENSRLANWISEIYKFAVESKRKKFAIIGGGETTVHVTGNGKGGRNQELALRIVENIQGKFTFLSFGTDGIDGNSPAGGAIVDSHSLENASLEIIEKYLKNNDSYHLLMKMGDVIVTGKTGNNVSDVFILLKN